MPTVTPTQSGCIYNCEPTQQQAPTPNRSPNRETDQPTVTEPPASPSQQSPPNETGDYTGRTVSKCEAAATQLGISWIPAAKDALDLMISGGPGRVVPIFRALPTDPCACGDNVSTPDGKNTTGIMANNCPDGQHVKINMWSHAQCYNDYNLYLQSDPSASTLRSTGDQFIVCKRDHPCTGTHTITRQLQLSTSTTNTSTSEVGAKIGKDGAEISAKISDAVATQNSLSTTNSQADAVPIFYPTENIPLGHHITGSAMVRDIPYALSGIGTKDGYPNFISNGALTVPVTTVCWQLDGAGPCLP